ncbi:DUF6207 family protein [Streptomyces sp. NPDC055089]
MESIDPQHVQEPGLVVLDITTADEATARLVMASLEQRWATSGITAARRLPGVPGVHARYTRTPAATVPRRAVLIVNPVTSRQTGNSVTTYIFDFPSASVAVCNHESASAPVTPAGVPLRQPAAPP